MKYPDHMHMMLQIFSDRGRDHSSDMAYLASKTKLPPSCVDPLIKMKTNLASEINRKKLKGLVKQFKLVQRRLRGMRTQ